MNVLGKIMSGTNSTLWIYSLKFYSPRVANTQNKEIKKHIKYLKKLNRIL